MKSLRKSFLTLLALTLFGGAGALAQEEVLLTTITATAKEQASYSTANVATVSFSYTSGGSSAYLANWGWWGYGFTATVNAAEGYTITKCIFYDDANRTATDSEAPFVVETTEADKTPRINGTPIDGGNMWSKGIKTIEVYGYAPEPAEIELTKVGDNQWSLSQTPDYDLELQVEYYEAHALKDIPAGWTVMVNGDDKTNLIVGDSLMITETDSVTLVPAGNPRRVKSVTLESLQSINVSGHKIYYLPGESWEQAIMNHPENTGWYIQGNYVLFDGLGSLLYDEYPYNEVGKGDNIDPNRPYYMGI